MAAKADSTGSRRRKPRVPVTAVTLEAIEREATRLFGERTYPVVGIRDISEAVGLLPGSLYVHISSKDALLRRIVERGIQNFLDVIAPIAAEDAPAADRIRRAIYAFAETLDATLAQSRIAFYQWTYLSGADREAVRAMRIAYEQLFINMVEEGIAAGEFRPVRNAHVAVHMMLGSVHSLCHWYSPDGELPMDQVAEMLADAAMFGLGAREPSPASKKASNRKAVPATRVPVRKSAVPKPVAAKKASARRVS
jgi:AcrR family transcriptional regulator